MSVQQRIMAQPISLNFGGHFFQSASDFPLPLKNFDHGRETAVALDNQKYREQNKAPDDAFGLGVQVHDPGPTDASETNEKCKIKHLHQISEFCIF
jgi:hypothetical protein